MLAPDDQAWETAGIDPCDDPDASRAIILLHLVSVDLNAQQVFGADQLQTLGGAVPVNRTRQRIGSGNAAILDTEQAGDGYVHTLDKIIQQ